MELATFRDDESLWELLSFAPTGESETWKDENFQVRFGVVTQLQYEFTPNDRGLLRYIFEQEILFHEHSPYQGLTETLHIAGWLLAQQKNILSIPHFIRAKFANFDTYCGFSILHVFSAGCETTVAYLQELATAESMEEEILKRYEPNQEVVDQWFEEQQEKYPLNPEEETLKTQVRRAYLLGKSREASVALDRWEAESERNPQELSTFRYWHHKLNQRERAIKLCREILRCEVPESLEAGETLTLAALLREEKRTDEAWNVLVDFVEAVEREPTKAKSRLTFQLLDEVWELAMAVGPEMPQVFEYGSELQVSLRHVPPAVLEKGAFVAMLYSEGRQSTHQNCKQLMNVSPTLSMI